MIIIKRIYCSRCGLNISDAGNNYNIQCRICNNLMKEIPYGYGFHDNEIEDFLQEKNNVDFTEHWKQLEQRLFDEVISKSPEFDQYLYDHKEEILADKEAEFNSVIAHGKAILEEASKVPKCPTCQSTNIRKMSGLESGASIYVFGIFSKKINKTFKCNSCGYTW